MYPTGAIVGGLRLPCTRSRVAGMIIESRRAALPQHPHPFAITKWGNARIFFLGLSPVTAQFKLGNRKSQRFSRKNGGLKLNRW